MTYAQEHPNPSIKWLYRYTSVNDSSTVASLFHTVLTIQQKILKIYKVIETLITYNLFIIRIGIWDLQEFINNDWT
jgi:hypothetical protein